MTRLPLPRIGAIAVATITVAALGAGIAALLLAPATPQALGEGSNPQVIDVTQQEFTDERSVDASITVSQPVDLTAPTGGRVTSIQCAAGGSVASGQSMLSIDGRPLLSLSTSVPLWRGLQVDDSGSDVRALQQELARLGQPVDVDGVFGGETLRALNALLAAVGVTDTLDGSLPLTDVLWMPSPTVTIASCKTGLGATLESGDAIATLPGGLARLTVANLPSDLIEGDRVLEVGADTVPIAADGTVTGDALAPLADTPEFRAALTATEPGTFGAKLILAAPLTVSALPPTAVYDVVDSLGCVASDGAGLPVRVAGSQLGQTFVLFDTPTPPATVEIQPRDTPACR